MQNFKFITVLTATLFLSFPSYSGIEHVEYIDTAGIKKTLNTLSTNYEDYVNNNSYFKIFVSSGLDRKLRIKTYHNDNLVSEYVSLVINTSDRQSAGGKEFYGKEVNLNHLVLDGRYRIVIDTLNLSDDMVASDTYLFSRDTVPPVIGDSGIVWSRTFGSFGNIDHFTHSGTGLDLRLHDLTDDLSGLSSATYFISTPSRLTVDPNDRTTLNANLNASNPLSGNVNIPVVSAVSPVVAPKQGVYTIGFNVLDNAGNKTTIKRDSYIDNICPKVSVTEVWNSSLNTWQSYSANMKIHENPVKMRWGRDVNDFEDASNAPFGWVKGHYEHYRDSDISYYERTFPVPQKYSYFQFHTRAGKVCNTIRLRNYNFTYAEGIDAAPSGTGVWFKTDLPDNSGEWIKSTTPRYNKPYTITDVKIHVAARSYRQKAWGSSIPACYIEVGETSCDSTTNISHLTGRGYSPKALYVSQDNGEMAVHFSYLYTYWDFNAPAVVSIDFNHDVKTIAVNSYDADSADNWTRNMWVIATVKVHLSLQGSNSAQILSAARTEKLDLRNRTDYFDVSGLADGRYDVNAVATDTYGNAGSYATDMSIIVDNTPPQINLSYDDSVLGDAIQDIRKISVEIIDFSDASIVSGRLYGSSSNENVYLGIITNSDGSFSFEQPKIFPTLLADERYGLEIISSDIYGNESTVNIKFKYLPDNLIEMNLQTYLSVDTPLLTGDDKPLASIRSTKPLVMIGGMLATGLQDAYITSRSNSTISIYVRTILGDVELAPGETKSISIDLGETGSSLDVIVYPTSSEGEGSADIMFDIPQLRSKYN